MSESVPINGVMVGRESIIPPGTEHIYDEWHFSEATRVGNIIWVSGQRGFDADGNISDDLAAQARVAWQNIDRALRHAGASLDDIVAMTSYHVDMSELEVFRAVKDEVIRPPYPAWTVVGVTALADPQMRVEIAVVAVRGSGRGAEPGP